MAFYSLDKIKSVGATYNFILGGRGTGKTYSVIKDGIDDRLKYGKPFVYMRRYKESIIASKVSQLCAPHYKYIEEKTNGVYNHVGVWRSCLWLENRDDEGKIVAKDPVPLAFLVSLNTQDNDKGEDKGPISSIIFDEVIARNGYLRDEWAIFCNAISSLVRHRTGVKIYMLANPISKFCLYFDELGIDFDNAKQGKLYVIKYDEEGKMKTAFEWLADSYDGSSSVADEYFGFKDNDKVKSIVSGYWEFDVANHLPAGVYKVAKKVKEIYIEFVGKFFCCEIMKHKDVYFLFYRPTEKIPEKTYYLTTERRFDKYAIVGVNRRHRIFDTMQKIFETGQVYYATNQCADYISGFREKIRTMKI